MQCVKDIGFFAITEGPWSFNNIFGIGPLDEANAPTYVQALKNNGIIHKKVVFLYLNPNSTMNITEGNYSILSFGT